MSGLKIACIPAFNEASSIGSVVEAVREFVDLVIVVDDGSVDNTEQLAVDAGAKVFRHPVNSGKGSALKVAFSEALKHDPDVVVMLDGDGQHDPSDIPRFIEVLNSGDFGAVIGSRYLGDSKTNAPFYRRVGLGFLHFVSRMSKKNGVKDTQSGYRAFSREAVELLLDGKEAGYNVEMEQIKVLGDNRVSIGEIPISVNYDVPYPSKKNPLQHGFELMSYMINLMLVERPLLFLGVPGAFIFFLGVGVLIWFLNQFNESGYFSIPLALISMGFILFGMLLVTNSFVLHSIQRTRAASR